MTHIPKAHPLSHIIPPKAADLISGDFAKHFRKNHSKCMVQSVVTQHVQAKARTDLNELVDKHYTEGKANKSDVIHTRVMTNKSMLTRALMAPLTDEKNNIAASLFGPWLRFILNLPLPVPCNEAGTQPTDSDVPTFTCQTCGRQCDHNGDEFCGCTNAAAPRAIMHIELAKVVQTFGEEALGETHYEPGTSEVLLNLLTPEDCRTRFPKAKKGEAGIHDDLLARLLKAIRTTTSPEERKKLLQEVGHATNKHVAHMSDSKGLRIDVQIKLPRHELLIDVGTTHHTQKSMTTQMFAWATAIQASEKRARTHNILVPPNITPTPVVGTVVKNKVTKYSPLMRVLEAHHLLKKRSNMPKFYACIASHGGELSPHFHEVIELLAAQVKQRYKRERPMDGLTPAQAAASFRTRFKDRIATVVAKGFGRMARMGGIAHRGGG